MDETPKPVVGPESSHPHLLPGQLTGTTAAVEPVAWHSLDPKLTKAIVEAQRLATTVENDGVNTGGHGQGGSGYRYATHAAISDRARDAMGSAGLALIQIGWRPIENGMIYAEFVLVHEEGTSSPVFSATMAGGQQKDRAKSISAGLSTMRKYVLAGLLNMGWTDPTEDVDADDPRKKQDQRPAQNRPTQDDGRASKERAHQHRQQKLSIHLSEVAAAARTRFRYLVDSGFDKDMIYSLATGAQQPMPDKPMTSELAAVVLAGTIVQHAAKCGRPPPPTNRELLEYMSDNMDGSPLWRHGKITAEGESLDREWPRPGGR